MFGLSDCPAEATQRQQAGDLERLLQAVFQRNRELELKGRALLLCLFVVCRFDCLKTCRCSELGSNVSGQPKFPCTATSPSLP